MNQRQPASSNENLEQHHWSIAGSLLAGLVLLNVAATVLSLVSVTSGAR